MDHDDHDDHGDDSDHDDDSHDEKPIAYRTINKEIIESSSPKKGNKKLISSMSTFEKGNKKKLHWTGVQAFQHHACTPMKKEPINHMGCCFPEARESRLERMDKFDNAASMDTGATFSLMTNKE